MSRTQRTWVAVAVAFVLGLALATAGTATAARLITGKDIKNGTITAKDLSKAVRAKLGATGQTGPQGPVGPQGPTGAQGPAGETGAAGPGAVRLDATLPKSDTGAVTTLATVGSLQVQFSCTTNPFGYTAMLVVKTTSAATLTTTRQFTNTTTPQYSRTAIAADASTFLTVDGGAFSTDALIHGVYRSVQTTAVIDAVVSVVGGSQTCVIEGLVVPAG